MTQALPSQWEAVHPFIPELRVTPLSNWGSGHPDLMYVSSDKEWMAE